MPPTDEKLTSDEIATLRSWIDQGAAAEHSAALPALTEKDVVPIFQMRCAKCHGKRLREGDLDLRTLASRLKGGRSGPAIVRICRYRLRTGARIWKTRVSTARGVRPRSGTRWGRRPIRC